MTFFEKYHKIFAFCGMIGPFFYAMIWILGGILQPGYNHITDDVSTLLAVGAPNKLLFDIMETAYAVLMIIFFASLHWTINKGKGSVIGPFTFLINFIIHLVAVFFPLDAGGGTTSQTAQIHGILVGLMVLLSMIGLVGMWLRLRKADGWSGYGTYTLVTLLFTLIFGVLAAVPTGFEIMGLTERLVATTMGQYFVVIGLKVYLTSQ
jgi:hypothetical protein